MFHPEPSPRSIEEIQVGLNVRRGRIGKADRGNSAEVHLGNIFWCKKEAFSTEEHGEEQSVGKGCFRPITRKRDSGFFCETVKGTSPPAMGGF